MVKHQRRSRQVLGFPDGVLFDMWVYQQSTGILTAPDGNVIGYGYSGNGADLNNPKGEGDVGHGPIPTGFWVIGSFFDGSSIGKGHVVSRLSPCPGNDMDGRQGGFMIHGDNSQANHTASDGCIILARPIRVEISQSGDTLLQVIA